MFHNSTSSSHSSYHERLDGSSEKVHDSKRLKCSVNRAEINGVRAKRVLGNGAHDVKENFGSFQTMESDL